VFVEVDCMDSLAFDTTLARPAVVQAFRDHDVHLHVRVDELGLPMAGWPDSAGVRLRKFRRDHLGSPDDILGVREAKGLVYRYCLFGDTIAAGGKERSGMAPVGGNHFAVTQGIERRRAANRIVPWQNQAGVFMHELGHTLNLNHGGGDAINHKPNYISVMNYSWTEPAEYSKGFWRLRYSSDSLNTLTEEHLVDSVGIGAVGIPKVPIGIISVVGPAGMHEEASWVRGTGRADWDQSDTESVKTEYVTSVKSIR